jgi:hypothetical protein
LGLTNLYQGISYYDAFVYDSAMNCYKFDSPLARGETPKVTTTTIDLSFLKTPTNDTLGSTLVSGAVAIIGSSDRPYVKQQRIGTNTHRMTVNFFSGRSYRICYTLKYQKMVGNEYSIVVNVPTTPMVYLNTFPNATTIYNSSYTIFEYINHNYFSPIPTVPEPTVLTVTNCFGSSSIFGTVSYGDM